MNAEQHLLDTFAGKAAGRAPVVPKIWFDLAARLTGLEPRALIEDPELAVLTTIDAAEQTGCDAARVLLMNQRQTRQEGERLVEFEDGRILGGIDLSGGGATHLDDPADFSIDNPAHTGFRTFRKHHKPRVHSLAHQTRKSPGATAGGGNVTDGVALSGGAIGICDYTRLKSHENQCIETSDVSRSPYHFCLRSASVGSGNR